MSSILFGLEVVAFLIVVLWTYANDGVLPSTAEKGLLKMKPSRPATAPSAQAKAVVPNWRRERVFKPTGGRGLWKRSLPKWERFALRRRRER